MAVFNRQDGQLALGSKTPVSILQEILQKKGMSPHYELIYNGVGTPDPRFKFRVTAEGITAVGDGKSKKEAKHDAAAALLRRLLANNEEAEEEEVDIASPYTGALKTNYVGILEEICFLNKIPPANFAMVSEEGPPHARVFTMRCDVSSISEIAVARTKKQAKHLVAQKMVDRIRHILKDKFIPAAENDDASEEIMSDREKIINGSFHHDLTHRVKDLHNVFHAKKDEQPLPSIFLELPGKPDEYYESVEKPQVILEEVVEALEGVVKTNYISNDECKASVKEIIGVFECDHYKDYEDDDKREVEPSNICRIDVKTKQNSSSKVMDNNVDQILPDFPLDEEEDKENEVPDVKEVKPENTNSPCVEELKNLRVQESNNFESSEDVAYSFLKVEVPYGLWEFIGRGRFSQEALDNAARIALKFLRMLAIPPPPPRNLTSTK